MNKQPNYKKKEAFKKDKYTTQKRIMASGNYSTILANIDSKTKKYQRKGKAQGWKGKGKKKIEEIKERKKERRRRRRKGKKKKKKKRVEKEECERMSRRNSPHSVVDSETMNLPLCTAQSQINRSDDGELRAYLDPSFHNRIRPVPFPCQTACQTSIQSLVLNMKGPIC